MADERYADHYDFRKVQLVERRVSLQSSLNGMIGPYDWQLHNADASTIVLHLSSIKIIGHLPGLPWQWFGWAKSASLRVEQRIVIRVGNQQWLSWRHGRLSIYSYFLTLKAIFLPLWIPFSKN